MSPTPRACESNPRVCEMSRRTETVGRLEYTLIVTPAPRVCERWETVNESRNMLSCLPTPVSVSPAVCVRKWVTAKMPTTTPPGER